MLAKEFGFPLDLGLCATSECARELGAQGL